MAGSGIDVLVVGSGLAGTSAAIEAARAGAKVALASLGDTFSGSSFHGGTWGLGLVGPASEADRDDLASTILEVGRGVADPALVRQLVEGVCPAVAWLEGMGVELRQPHDPSQRAYVPCFDHRPRSWHGLVRTSLRRAWQRELDRLGVLALPHTELVDVVEREGAVQGAVLFDHATGEATLVPCGAVVLATGGLAGLYERRLGAPDSCGSAHGIALAHGCELVNAEFLQMMPGLVSPVRGVVVNEKALRFSSVDVPAPLLEERSGYGPFTSRLASSAVDRLICAAGPEGLPLSHRLPDEPDELVADYFSWLAATYGIDPEDEVRVALFAHASNGGIAVGADCSCAGGPRGLYACGECAGGIHGADRLGGLASAAALVFGRVAGTCAAHAAGQGHAPASPLAPEWEASPLAGEALGKARRLMSAHAMVGRTREGLGEALRGIGEARSELRATARPAGDATSGAATLRAHHQLAAASAMLAAMLAREESRGSHHRADHPGEDPSLACQIRVGRDGATRRAALPYQNW